MDYGQENKFSLLFSFPFQQKGGVVDKPTPIPRVPPYSTMDEMNIHEIRNILI